MYERFRAKKVDQLICTPFTNDELELDQTSDTGEKKINSLLSLHVKIDKVLC